MGGFQLFEHPDQPTEPSSEKNDYLTRGVGRFVRILEFKDVLEHKLETIIHFTTEKEIKDRGKSDGISKFIVLFQTLWFILQCIARGIKHLPLTELEIVTLAYSMMNLFIYIYWWDKPRDVGCPIRVYENLTTNRTAAKWAQGAQGIFEKVCIYALGWQDQYVVLSQECKVSMFWSGGVEDKGSGERSSTRAAFGPSILGIAFGAIHCIAWSYVFPSHSELVLWRVSCVAMMVVPLFSTLVSASTVAQSANGDVEFALLVVFFLCAALLGLSAWLYIAARIATLVMAFTTLRSLPSEAFAVVDWTTFIPHI
jgi:hypothetical protein